MVNNQEEFYQALKEIQEEINSWKLSESDYKIFSSMIEILFCAAKDTDKDIILNRFFCPVCHLKEVMKEAIEGVHFVEYFKKIQLLKNDITSLYFCVSEFKTLFFLFECLETIGSEIFQDELKNYLCYQKPNLKSKESIEKILSLSVITLAFNAMLTENVKKILDIVTSTVYSMHLNTESQQRMIRFLIERIFSMKLNYTIVNDKKEWAITLHKFNPEKSKTFIANDPVFISQTYN